MKSYYSLSATAAIFMTMSSSLIHAVTGSQGGSSSGSVTTTTSSTSERRLDLLDGLANESFLRQHYYPKPAAITPFSGGERDMDYPPNTPINNQPVAEGEDEPEYDTGLRGSVGKWKRYNGKNSKKGKKDKKRGCRHKHNGNPHHGGHRYPQRNCNPNPDCIDYAVYGRKKCCSSTVVPVTSTPTLPPPTPSPVATVTYQGQDVEWCTEDDDESRNNDGPNYDNNNNNNDGPSGGVPSPTPPTTDRPTITSSPTMTAKPTTFEPTTSEPSALQRAGGQSNTDFISQKNYCTTFPAKFETLDDGETAIVLWAAGTEKDLEANAIAAINSIVATPILESDTSKYKLDVTFKIKPNDADVSKDDMDKDGDFDLNDIGLRLDVVVSKPMVLAIAGCNDEAQQMATDYYNEHSTPPQDQRKIEEGSESKLAVMRDWVCGYENDGDEVPCVTEDGMCVEVSCSTSINYIGSLGYDAIKAIIEGSSTNYYSMMDNISTWYIQQGAEIKIEEVPTGSGISAINETVIREQKSATKAGPFIGAAAGLLALLLLLLLFVRCRNRNNDDEVSHLKMEDDDTLDDDNSAKAEYTTRDIHVVGEGDSVISHWTGYTGQGKPSDGNYEMELYNKNGVQGITTDVHQCSSATCEICARNRQAGLSFISTGAAAGATNDDLTRNRSLPSDASREYPIEDTVEL